jgi:uncharacterized protein
MRILFEITHPVDLHMFKQTIHSLLNSGHQVKITAREKDGIPELLRAESFDYEILSSQGKGLLGLGIEMFKRDWRLLRVARKFKPDVMIGSHAIFAAQVARLLRIPSLVFLDMETQVLTHLLGTRFATVLLTPAGFNRQLGQIFYNGCLQVLYLHPNRFTPDPTVLAEAGLTGDQTFFLVRMVSWTAHHDVGKSGLEPEKLKQLIKKLESQGKVFISSEEPLSEDLRRYQIPVARSRLHHLMHYASLLIGESTTMAAESAMLGTPAVVCNTLEHGYIQLFQNKYKMVFRYRQQEELIARVDELLAGELETTPWKKRHEKMVSEMIDGTDMLLKALKLFEDGCHDRRELKRRLRELPGLY